MHRGNKVNRRKEMVSERYDSDKTILFSNESGKLMRQTSFAMQRCISIRNEIISVWIDICSQ